MANRVDDGRFAVHESKALFRRSTSIAEVWRMFEVVEGMLSAVASGKAEFGAKWCKCSVGEVMGCVKSRLL